MTNKYITVAYRLYSAGENGTPELLEEAPVAHPFQFISGMGVALDTFEAKILELNQGDKFDFQLTAAEAYGAYEKEHVLTFPKENFTVNGHFDSEHIREGAIIPLVNEDGMRFQGLVTAVTAESVTVDLNHPLAGRDLRFEGEVVTMREATNEELQALVAMMSGEGCGCGCGSHGEEAGGCGCGGHGHGNGECCGGHGHGEGECCGGHGHGEGSCGCGGHEQEEDDFECCGGQGGENCHCSGH